MASGLSSLLGSSSSSGTSGAASTSTSGASSASSAATPAPSEEVFLQLLVSQIQNQDPLNPTDSTQFVSQLAQFSELEQVIAIRGDIETAMSQSSQQSSTTPATPTGASPTSTNPTDPSTTTNSAGISSIAGN